jgi:nitrite reductase/ring-hydroxylating ferredoxin subunit
VRLLGEDLVMYRDETGQPGLLGLHCPHRGADLSYGRLEDGGLRCIYHGWLFDRTGRCLEQPGEPGGSTFHERIRQTAYPCREIAGVIFAYLGPGKPPLFPNYEVFRVPDDHRWVHKHYHECSYLQGNEGNIDSIHVRFLHRFLPGGRFGQGVSSEGRRPMDLTTFTAPKYEETHFGLRIFEGHQEPSGPFVQSKNFVMPLTCAVGGGPVPTGDGYLMNWHVPIDDTRHWRYSMAFKRSGPIDPRYTQARASVTDEQFHFIRNRDNRYLQDRVEQKHDTFAGLGPVFVVGDHFATETAGAIQDRSQEHLAATDGAIVAMRLVLLRAIKDVQRGADPLHVLRDPAEQERLLEITVVNEPLPAGTTWNEFRVPRDGHLAAVSS